MAIYFLFGQTGVGKSFIGQHLQNAGICFIEGDDFITDEMTDCLRKDEQMTREMIYVFTERLVSVIKEKQRENPNKMLVVSQAMYLDDCRQKLQASIPGLQFIWVRAVKPERLRRIATRFAKRSSKVSAEYALEMDCFFEAPSVQHHILNNNSDSIDEINAQLVQIMPENADFFLNDKNLLQISSHASLV